MSAILKNIDSKTGSSSAEKWGCEIKGVVLEKGCGDDRFTLKIDALDLTTNSPKMRKLPLMGKTGAGKSTLLNLMSAMELPDKGTISWTFPEGNKFEWGRKGLTSAKARLLRRKFIGFAFQDSTLIPHLNVLDNLSYPLQLNSQPIEQARQKAIQSLEKVLVENETIDSLKNKFPAQLSGGQRQRVALVQAMVHDPYILFADEPTGSLDSVTRRQVMGVLHDWVDEVSNQRALFWVTHHDDDPKNAKVSKRLWVNNGECKYKDIEC